MIVTTHLEDLEKSGNCKVVRKRSGKMGEKSGITILSFCRPARANTLNNEMEFLSFFAYNVAK